MTEFMVATAAFILILLGIIQHTEQAIIRLVQAGKLTYSPYDMTDPAPAPD